MSSSHYPNIYFVSARASQSLELLFLEHAKEFGLQRRRDIANLI
jgi:hypothetical protein